MKITKVKMNIDDGKKVSFLKGVITKNVGNLYDIKNLNKNIEIKKIIENRVKDANIQTERMYSIFKKNKLSSINALIIEILKNKEKNIDSILNNYRRNIIDKDIDKIDKLLKEEYKNFSETVKLICNLKNKKISLTKDYEDNIKNLVDTISENINRIIKTRDSDKIVKSIKNQKIRYEVGEDKNIILNNEDNKELFKIIKENKLKDLFLIIDQCFFVLDNQTENSVFLDLDKNIEFCKNVSDTEVKSIKYNQNNFDVFMKTLNNKIDLYTKTNSLKNKWIIRKTREFIVYDLKTDFFKNEINYNTFKTRLNNDKIKKKVFGKINNYINSKIVEYGKIIHYFKDEKNITSFDLETIKAYEELTKAVNSSLLFALAIAENIDSTNEKEVLRYFGGLSKFDSNTISKYNDLKYIIKNNEQKIQNIFLEILNKMRNTTFHFDVETMTYQDTLRSKYINSLNFLIDLYHKNCSQISLYIQKKYESNNVFAFYKYDDIKNMIGMLYSNSSSILTSQVFIPSFKNIFSSIRKEETFKKLTNNNLNLEFDFGQTISFVLQEIYYQAFLQENDFKQMFFDNVIEEYHETYNRNNKRNLSREDGQNVEPFESFYSLYKENKKCKFDAFSKTLQVEVMREDSKLAQVDQGKLSHYTLIFRQMLAKSFLKYIQQKFNFIFNPNIQQNNNSSINLSFDNYSSIYANLIPKEVTKENYSKTNFLLTYYVLYKFVPNTEINLIKGTFQHYKQYIEDIKLRAEYNSVSTEFINKYMLGSNNQNKILKYFDDILKILNLCQETSTVVSNNWQDYYDTKDDYAKFISQFIESKFNTFEDLKKWDTTKKYQDEQNPILFSQIEKSRMFNLMDIVLGVYNSKITVQDINDLNKIKNSDSYKKFYKLMDLKSFNNEDVWKKTIDDKVRYIQLINKVQLTDISRVTSLIIDLYSPMLSWLYMWERDCQYFLLGLLKIKDIKKIKELDSCNYIKKIFSYGNNLDYKYKIDNVEKPISNIVLKLEYFITNISDIIPDDKTLQNFILKQFFKIKEVKDFPRYLRNFIEHYNYFKRDKIDSQNIFKDYSILDLYTDIATKLLCYNKKLQNNVVPKIINILEKHKIVWEGKKLSKDKDKYYKDFLSKLFIESVSRLLNYPKIEEVQYKEKNKKMFKLDENRKIILDSILISDKCGYVCPIKQEKKVNL